MFLYSHWTLVAGHSSRTWTSSFSRGISLTPHLLVHGTGNFRQISKCFCFWFMMTDSWQYSQFTFLQEHFNVSWVFMSRLLSIFVQPEFEHLTTLKRHSDWCFSTARSSPVHEHPKWEHFTVRSRIWRWQAVSENICYNKIKFGK